MQQSGIVELIVDLLLQLTQAFLPFGILLGNRFTGKVIYNSLDYGFQLFLAKLKKGIVAQELTAPQQILNILLDDDG